MTQPPIQERLKNILTQLQHIWRTYWQVRWLVMNGVVWSIALLCIAIFMQLFGGWGILIGGFMTGLVVGIGQTWAMGTMLPVELQVNTRRWVIYSALSGTVAIIPVALLVWLLFFNLTFALVIMGGLFGGILASGQYTLITNVWDEHAWLWIVASILGGMLCAPLTLYGGQNGIPILISFGPASFALITGICLWFIRREFDNED